MRLFSAVITILVSASLVSQQPASGSTVAFIRTPTEIVVGADSVALAVQDASMVLSFCKITQIGDMFIAMVGLGPDSNGESIVISTAREARSRGGKILDAANTFTETIITPLPKSLNKLGPTIHLHIIAILKVKVLSELYLWFRGWNSSSVSERVCPK